MFYNLTGKIIIARDGIVALDVNGIGFKLFASDITISKCSEGERLTLFTRLLVREDAMDLYGFYEKDELECFKLLTGISGVGPKAALAILSVLTPDTLALSVAGEDVKSITAAQGVGPKIAHRIVLELKGKLDGFAHSASQMEDIAAVKKANISYAGEDAVNALTQLGYSKSEASIIIGKMEPGLTTEQMIKQALKQLAKF